MREIYGLKSTPCISERISGAPVPSPAVRPPPLRIPPTAPLLPACAEPCIACCISWPADRCVLKLGCVGASGNGASGTGAAVRGTAFGATGTGNAGDGCGGNGCELTGGGVSLGLVGVGRLFGSIDRSLAIVALSSFG